MKATLPLRCALGCYVTSCEDHSGKQWSEECVAFNPGHSFTVRFISEAPNFPFPTKTMRGGWQVVPADSGSHVMVWWELTPANQLLAPVILSILAFQADRDFPLIVRRMATAAIGKNGEAHMQSSTRLFARLFAWPLRMRGSEQAISRHKTSNPFAP